MTTQKTTEYDAPAVWAPRLVAWAEREQADLLEMAEDSRQKGHRKNAASLTAEAGRYIWIADYARSRLVDLSDLTQADVQADEPPAPLVDLTDWLRGKLGRYFPRVPVTIWQGIATVLHSWRGRP